MSRSTPPVKMSRPRAQALVDAAVRGIDEWTIDIGDNLRHAIDVGDQEHVARLRQLDDKARRAREALVLIEQRYLGKRDEPLPGNAPLF